MRTRRVLLAGAVALAAAGTTVATATAANAVTNIYEAESATNARSGAATVTRCGRCSEGAKVSFAGNAAGTLQFNGVTAATAGDATLTVSYGGVGARQAQLSVNGGAPTTLSFVGAPDDVTIVPLTATVALAAGVNTLTFTNAGGLAPEFDAISVATAGDSRGSEGDGVSPNRVSGDGSGAAGDGGAGAGAPDAGGAAGGPGVLGGASAMDTAAGAAAAPTAAELLAKVTGCDPVSQGSYEADGGPGAVSVCAASGAVFWRSAMAIDCDGQRSSQCNEDTDCCFAGGTAFQQSDGQPLDSAELPYIVVPGVSGIWDYGDSGVRAGSVAAVIYNGRVSYAVVGDVGPTRMIGEGSYSLAESLGINPDPSVGGAGSGVTFLVFTGPGSVVTPIESHAAAVSLGERLARQFIADN
jgi:hypothetical protein